MAGENKAMGTIKMLVEQIRPKNEGDEDGCLLKVSSYCYPEAGHKFIKRTLGNALNGGLLEGATAIQIRVTFNPNRKGGKLFFEETSSTKEELLMSAAKSLGEQLAEVEQDSIRRRLARKEPSMKEKAATAFKAIRTLNQVTDSPETMLAKLLLDEDGAELDEGALEEVGKTLLDSIGIDEGNLEGMLNGLLSQLGANLKGGTVEKSAAGEAAAAVSEAVKPT